MNHRSNKLDFLLGKKVEVVFFDDFIAYGVLYFGNLYCGCPSDMYSVLNGNYELFFRKSQIKRIKEVINYDLFF